MTKETMNDAPVISLREVSLTLGRGPARNTALVDINLDVAAGELVAITGRSGSGKSSLLNVAGGLIAPSAGSVHLDGADLAVMTTTQLAAIRRRSVGYVFQDLNLVETLTAVENVALPLELDGTASKDARQAAHTSLDEVGVGELADRYPDELSGGQRQRVAIARALVDSRHVLLADEPTGALDEVTGESIMRVLRAQCERGAAMLLVTHDPSLAAWADRVVRLRDGRIDSVSKSRSTASVTR